MRNTTRGLGGLALTLALSASLTGGATTAMPLSSGLTATHTGPSTTALPWKLTDTPSTTTTRHLVLAAEGTSDAAARAAIERAGGTVARAVPEVGLYTVNARGDLRTRLAGSNAIEGVTADSVIGVTRDGRAAERLRESQRIEEVQELLPARSAERTDNSSTGSREAAPRGQKGKDSLEHLQWNMEMIKARQAQRTATGEGARVAILDSGVDASHPDLEANVNTHLSRNFVTDIPEVDGPCETASCVDPVDEDQIGHGTHVASIVASARNGHGTVGVAPDAEIITLRVAQDSGFVFLEPVVNALVEAPKLGTDVVNMSFAVDPWLFNCTANPADSPEEQEAQQLTRTAMLRALHHAKTKGVTLVGAMGNSGHDLGKKQKDTMSPTFPPKAAKERTVTPDCASLPAEGPGTLGVTGVGPSKVKGFYSSYGTSASDVTAPGGSFYDFYGTEKYQTPENTILAAWPADALKVGEEIDENGKPLTPLVVREKLAGGKVAYYKRMQGTSMASPHVAGVAALLVDEKGYRDWKRGGKGMSPWYVDRVIKDTASAMKCDAKVYEYEGLPAPVTAICDGSKEFNGFYGHGMVNAAEAVR